jgi:hypothetical protein
VVATSIKEETTQEKLEKSRAALTGYNQPSPQWKLSSHLHEKLNVNTSNTSANSQSSFDNVQLPMSSNEYGSNEIGRALGLQPHHVQQPDEACHKHQNRWRRFRQPQKDLLPSLRSSQSVVETLSSVDGSKFDGRTTPQ